jgi:hypothetical protein
MKKKLITVSAILIVIVGGLIALPKPFANQKLCLKIRFLSWQIARADESKQSDIFQDQDVCRQMLLWNGYLVEKVYELKHIHHNTPDFKLFSNRLSEFLKSDCSLVTVVELGHVEPDSPKNDILVITVLDRPNNIEHWDEFVAKECKPKR